MSAGTPNPVQQQLSSLAVANQGIGIASENQRAKLQAQMQASMIRQRGAEATLRANTQADMIKAQTEMAALDRESRTEDQNRADTRQQREMDFASGEAETARLFETKLTLGMADINRRIQQDDLDAAREWQRGNYERAAELDRRTEDRERESAELGLDLSRFQTIQGALTGQFRDRVADMEAGVRDHFTAISSRMGDLDLAADRAIRTGTANWRSGSLPNPLSPTLSSGDRAGSLKAWGDYMGRFTTGVRGREGGKEEDAVRVRGALLDYWIGGMIGDFAPFVPEGREAEFAENLSSYIHEMSYGKVGSKASTDRAAKNLWKMRELASEDRIIGKMVKNIGERAEFYMRNGVDERARAADDFQLPNYHPTSEGVREGEREFIGAKLKQLLGPIAAVKSRGSELASGEFVDAKGNAIQFGSGEDTPPNLRPLNFKDVQLGQEGRARNMIIEVTALMEQFLPEDQFNEAIGHLPPDLRAQISAFGANLRQSGERLGAAEGFDLGDLLDDRDDPRSPLEEIAQDILGVERRREGIGLERFGDQREVFREAGESLGDIIDRPRLDTTQMFDDLMETLVTGEEEEDEF